MTAPGPETNEFLECSYADKMIICCSAAAWLLLVLTQLHITRSEFYVEVRENLLSGDGKLSKAQFEL